MENELLMYWALSVEVSVMQRTDAGMINPDEFADLRDELDILSEMTDWNNLKAATRRQIAALDKLHAEVEAVA